MSASRHHSEGFGYTLGTISVWIMFLSVLFIIPGSLWWAWDYSHAGKRKRRLLEHQYWGYVEMAGVACICGIIILGLAGFSLLMLYTVIFM